jgi:hypothetical protein
MMEICTYHTVEAEAIRLVTTTLGSVKPFARSKLLENEKRVMVAVLSYVGKGVGEALGAVGLAVGSRVGGLPTGSMHCSEPFDKVTFPPAQAAHCVAPKVSTADPIGQSVHVLRPEEEAKEPAWHGEHR